MADLPATATAAASLAPDENQKPQQPGAETEDAAPAPAPAKPKKAAQLLSITPELLRQYYDRLFPASLMFQWLCYGSGSAEKAQLREWSFTLKDDIYIRYLSFATKEEFKQGLMSKIPYKIDIGATYNAPPKMHLTVNKFAPEQKELVFDVDMTDYDDVRTCCSDAQICMQCWPLMAAAIKVTDTALRTDFGFKNILWVFSGRRGVHGWVCDERARTLTNEARSAVIHYLSVEPASERNPVMDIPFPLPPSLQRAYRTLEPYFIETSIKQQRVLEDDTHVKRILEMIGSAADRRQQLVWDNKETDGLKRWAQLKRNVDTFLAKKNITQYKEVRTLLARIVFTYVYPRLDVNVSKQMNHLLKSPFCVHPKTGHVCIPIDPSAVDEFNPFKAPTLAKLHEQLNQPHDETPSVGTKRKKGDASKLKLWQRTDMRKHIEYFAKFVVASKAAVAAESKKKQKTEAGW